MIGMARWRVRPDVVEVRQATEREDVLIGIGTVSAEPGDFIVSVKGCVEHVLKPPDFYAMYERVDDDTGDDLERRVGEVAMIDGFAFTPYVQASAPAAQVDEVSRRLAQGLERLCGVTQDVGEWTGLRKILEGIGGPDSHGAAGLTLTLKVDLGLRWENGGLLTTALRYRGWVDRPTKPNVL